MGEHTPRSRIERGCVCWAERTTGQTRTCPIYLEVSLSRKGHSLPTRVTRHMAIRPRETLFAGRGCNPQDTRTPGHTYMRSIVSYRIPGYRDITCLSGWSQLEPWNPLF